MARKVSFHITLDVFINESDYALLQLLGSLSARGERPIVMTARSFSTRLNLSLATVRRSCRTLASKGLISVRGQTRDDGGCTANAYEVTPLGREVLSSKGTVRPRREPRG